MSKNLVEYELENGATIAFETDEEFEEDGPTRLSGGDSSPIIKKADKTLKEVSQRIGPAAETILSSLRDINTPEEIEMEFGLNFKLGAGLVVAKADSEVNFKVTVKWVNKDAGK